MRNERTHQGVKEKAQKDQGEAESEIEECQIRYIREKIRRSEAGEKKTRIDLIRHREEIYYQS